MKQYQVRVPSVLVGRYGKAILSERFDVPELAAKWKADKRQEFAELKAQMKLSDQVRRANMRTQHTISFREAVAGWLAACEVPKPTLAWYKILTDVHLMPMLRDVALPEIGRARVLDVMAKRKAAGASKDAMSKDLWALKSVLKWARDRGMAVDPTAWAVKRRKPVPELTRRFEPEKIEAFLACLTGRDRAALEIAAGTGMRQGEIRAARVEWVRWLEGRIHVPADQQYTPKGRKPRSIPIHKRLKAWLEVAVGERTEGRLFPPMTGGQGIYLRGIVHKARELSGLYVRGMHDFRHHYASLLVLAGEDIRVIQEILGHADITTTRRYLQLREGYLIQAGRALDRLSSVLSSATKQKRPPTIGSKAARRA